MDNGVTTGNATTVNWSVIDDVRPLAAVTERQHHPVSDAQISDFARDGVVLLPGLFADWVAPLAAGLDRVMTTPDDYAFPCDSVSPGEPGRFFDCYCNWQRVPEWSSFVLNSAAASIAAQLMASTTAQFFHEHAFSKEQGTNKATPWHHDLPYYCVEGLQTASVYVALDSTPVETAVRFLRGSHRDGNLYVPRTFRDGGEYATGDATLASAPQDIAVDDTAVFATALEPGDTLVFDFRTLHGTTDAPITGRRRAFSTRWLGDDVHYHERSGATSPPLTDLGLRPGDRMREDRFPVLWPS
jgi:ectoine hydroxylase-related dioxygenase (phytanoyl-CoA dioxygenase family)